MEKTSNGENCVSLYEQDACLTEVDSSLHPSNGLSLNKPEEGEEEEDSKDVQHKIACIPVPYRLWVFVIYIFMPLVALIGYILDIVTDIIVAVRHYEDGHYWWSGLTLAFVFLPTVLFAVYTLNTVLRSKDEILKRIAWSVFYLSLTFIFLLLPVCRMMHVIKFAIYAMADPYQGHQYIKRIKEINKEEAAIQAVLKAFLESAPQLLLQLYIMMSRPPEDQSLYTVVAQLVSVIVSLITLTTRVTSLEMEHAAKKDEQAIDEHLRNAGIQYSPNAHRIKRDNPLKEYEICCAALEFIWRFCAISARIIALSLFASVFSYWLYLVCGIHMTVITMCMFLKEDRKSIDTFLITLFLSFMYIFSFVEYKVDLEKIYRTVRLYFIYYCFTFCQNTPMIILAYMKAPMRLEFHLPLLILHFVAFVIGVLFMVLYHAAHKALKLKTLAPIKVVNLEMSTTC